jgi:superfamily II DNA or RNA helicase
MDTLLWNYFGKPAAVATAPALATTCWRVPFRIIGNTEWLQRCRNDVKPMQWLAKLKTRNELLVSLIVSLYRKGYCVVGMSRFIDHVEEIRKMLIAAGIPETEIGQFTRTQGARKTKVGKDYLSEMKTRRIILGTYSMLKEGFDHPPLDAGVELLPVADNVQGIGRVRRPFAGKKKPVWFTIEDLNVPLFVRYTNSRLRGFESTNVIIKTLKKGSL